MFLCMQYFVFLELAFLKYLLRMVIAVQQILLPFQISRGHYLHPLDDFSIQF